jgi:hypothetical protein
MGWIHLPQDRGLYISQSAVHFLLISNLQQLFYSEAKITVSALRDEVVGSLFSCIMWYGASSATEKCIYTPIELDDQPYFLRMEISKW